MCIYIKGRDRLYAEQILHIDLGFCNYPREDPFYEYYEYSYGCPNLSIFKY